MKVYFWVVILVDVKVYMYLWAKNYFLIYVKDIHFSNLFHQHSEKALLGSIFLNIFAVSGLIFLKPTLLPLVSFNSIQFNSVLLVEEGNSSRIHANRWHSKINSKTENINTNRYIYTLSISYIILWYIQV